MSYLHGAAPRAAPIPLPVEFAKAHPAFKDSLNRLVARVQALDLPLVVKQLCREPDTQCYYSMEGGSKISNPFFGAHVHCMAADFRLDTSKSGHHWLVDARRNSKGKIDEYDTGVDKDSKGVKSIIARNKVYTLWQTFGSIVKNEFPELTWGGGWTDSKNPHLGWDPYHVELKGYTKRIPEPYRSQETWACDPKTWRAYKVDPSQDPSTALAVKADTLATEAKDRPFEFAGYGVGTLALVGGALGGAYWFWKRRRRR
jgi:hypothetical protein